MIYTSGINNHQKNSYFFSLFFIFFSFTSVFFFHLDIFFNIKFSSILTLFLFIFFYRKFKKNEIGLISLYTLAIWFLPFIHLIPYIFHGDFSIDPLRVGKGVGSTLIYDEKIVELMFMILVTTALGISLSISFFNKKTNKVDFNVLDNKKNSVNTLPLFFWFFWFILATVMFVGTTPPGGSFFNAVYHGRERGFLDFTDAAFLIAYIFIIFVIVDSFLDTNTGTRGIKKFFCLFILLAFILNLITGTREAIPFLFGFILFYYRWAYNHINKKQLKVSSKKIYLLIFMVFIFAQIVGNTRHALVNVNYQETLDVVKDFFNLYYFVHGTWSSAFKTTLSVAHDYIDFQDFRLGRDYWNLFLSIPPGFVADFIGYTRPISISSGPAWEMRYGVGGSHITVLPFRNFGMFGVFFLSFLLFSIILYIEKIGFRRFSVVNLCLLVAAITVIPLFIWYGEKFFINSVIIFSFFSVFYRICLFFRKKF